MLDAKTLGQTPAEIDARISVGIEARDFYLADIPYQVITATAAGAATATVHAPIAVPQGEMWFVYNVTSRATPTAAASPVFVAPTFFPTNSGSVQLCPAGVDNAFAGAGTWPIGSVVPVGVTMLDPMLAQPGAQFGTLRCTGGPAFTITTSVLIKAVRV